MHCLTLEGGVLKQILGLVLGVLQLTLEQLMLCRYCAEVKVEGGPWKCSGPVKVV